MSPVTIVKFIPGGQTIGTLPDGRKIFFWNALPGETIIDYQITKQKSHFVEAIATTTTRPSPHRIPEKDPCYLSTSPWQILDYEYELSTKRELLIEQFRQAGLFFNTQKALALSPDECQIPPSTLPTVTIPLDVPPVATDHCDFFYRNKMEYSLFFDHSDEKIHLAFRARGSHRKIPIAKSSIERPEIFQKAAEIVEHLNRTHADSRQFQSLLLRCNQLGQVEGGLYENHQPHPHFSPLQDFILGHKYSYSPNGFFQINLPVYEMALSTIKAEIFTSSVLDLYSGVGSIGLSVASDKHLTLVECDKSAYDELVNNVATLATTNRSETGHSPNTPTNNPTALANQPTNSNPAPHKDKSEQVTSLPTSSQEIQPVLAKSELALSFIHPDQTVILDPPRAGCARELLNKLLSVTPPKIIYLSCNPATQARDAAILISKYRITKIQPFNFFPRTPHLENLLIFERK